MPILHAIVLGLVQGLSEFLPISSSGHLLLVPWMFGWDDFDDESIEKAFDVALHIGTLVAAILYLRHDVARYIAAAWRSLVRRDRPLDTDGRVAWLLVLSTVPAAAIGAVFEDSIDEHLGTPTIIAISLIGFGGLLWYADRATGRRTVDEYSVRDALVVGAAQALASQPGDIAIRDHDDRGARAGFDRDSAARLSFLMMIPVTGGAVAFKMLGLVRDGGVPAGLGGPMVVGIVTSGISGWFAVRGLLRLIRTRSFDLFVLYRIALGVTVLALVARR